MKKERLELKHFHIILIQIVYNILCKIFFNNTFVLNYFLFDKLISLI